MSDYLVSWTMVQVGENLMSLTKKKLAFRGRDRSAIRKLQRALKMVVNADTRRNDAAQGEDVDPVLFAETEHAEISAAIGTLTSRCINALAEKVTLSRIG